MAERIISTVSKTKGFGADKYRMLITPGHGYLIVPYDELEKFGVRPTRHSAHITFQGPECGERHLAFLEEDCDAPAFARAANLHKGDTEEEYVEFNLDDLSDCFGRFCGEFFDGADANYREILKPEIRENLTQGAELEPKRYQNAQN